MLYRASRTFSRQKADKNVRAEHPFTNWQYLRSIASVILKARLTRENC